MVRERNFAEGRKGLGNTYKYWQCKLCHKECHSKKGAVKHKKQTGHKYFIHE